MHKSMFAILVAVVVILAVGPSDAGIKRPAFFNGTKLEMACQADAAPLDAGVCFGYVLGVADLGEGLQTASDKRFWCWPDDMSVTVGMERAMDAVRAYLAKYPESREWSGSAVVWEALKEKFPCH